MTPFNLSRWLGACALGLLVLGCRHSRKCDVICCDCCEHVQPVPADPPKKKAAVDTLPGFDKEVVKKEIKDERPSVSYRVVAPGMTSTSGDMVGTEEMTAADADKVHIRPGYTPGALWTPVSHQQQAPIFATEKEPKKAEPSEASENPSVPKMAIPQQPEEQTVPELPQ